jgi:hypothetical protein
MVSAPSVDRQWLLVDRFQGHYPERKIFPIDFELKMM